MPEGVKETEKRVWPGRAEVDYGPLAENKITDFVRGRTIEEVWKNKSILLMKFKDGDSVEIGWADKDGNPVEGEPVMIRRGRHVFAKTAVVGARGHRAG